MEGNLTHGCLDDLCEVLWIPVGENLLCSTGQLMVLLLLVGLRCYFKFIAMLRCLLLLSGGIGCR